jgi:Tfp pilus assembly protein PilF
MAAAFPARLLTAALSVAAQTVLAQPVSSTVEPKAEVRKVTRDCALSIWGCASRPGSDPSSLYDQTVQRARSQILFGQTAPGADLSRTVSELLDATKLLPERREAWIALAVTYAEQAACQEGAALFEQILARYGSPEPSSQPGTPPSVVMQWKDRQAILLGRALCQSRRGEHELATAQYRRMLLHDGPTQRLLYRLGDSLLGQGLPDEAVQVFRQACLEEPPLQPLVNVSRSCAGLLVALDRAQRQRPTRLMSQLRRHDLGLRFLKMSDFVPMAERDYYQAMLQPPSCEREALLVNYLRAAPATVPKAYLRRAEEHLSENRARVSGCVSVELPALRADGEAAERPALPSDAPKLPP